MSPECKTRNLVKIDENLRLWPCPFVSNSYNKTESGGKAVRDEFLNVLDKDWNSLQNKSFDEVFNHDAFTTHFNYEHWDDETKCSWICKRNCDKDKLKNMDLDYHREKRKRTKLLKYRDLPIKKSLQSLEFGITSHCNAGCSGCDRTDNNTRKARQDLKLIHTPTIKIKQCIDNAIEYFPGIKSIVFCGTRGDPMMHPDIEELIEYVCQRLHLKINTNGSIKSPEFYKRIANIHLKIVFAIDGLEDTNHIYRYGTSWDNIWNNLTSYCNAGGYAHWDFLVWEHNWHQIPKVKQICNNLGVKHVEFKITRQGTHRQGDGTPIVKSIEDEQTLNTIKEWING